MSAASRGPNTTSTSVLAVRQARDSGCCFGIGYCCGRRHDPISLLAAVRREAPASPAGGAVDPGDEASASLSLRRKTEAPGADRGRGCTRRGARTSSGRRRGGTRQGSHLLRRLDPVDDGHADVHQDEIRFKAPCQAHRGGAVGRACHDLDPVHCGEKGGKGVADQSPVVGDEDTIVMRLPERSPGRASRPEPPSDRPPGRR